MAQRLSVRGVVLVTTALIGRPVHHVSVSVVETMMIVDDHVITQQCEWNRKGKGKIDANSIFG